MPFATSVWPSAVTVMIKVLPAMGGANVPLKILPVPSIRACVWLPRVTVTAAETVKLTGILTVIV